MSRVILLDAGPLGMITKRRGVPEAEACRAWAVRCLGQGARILVPAIAYYEVGLDHGTGHLVKVTGLEIQHLDTVKG
jgi:hypothetical protein